MLVRLNFNSSVQGIAIAVVIAALGTPAALRAQSNNCKQHPDAPGCKESSPPARPQREERPSPPPREERPSPEESEHRTYTPPPPENNGGGGYERPANNNNGNDEGNNGSYRPSPQAPVTTYTPRVYTPGGNSSTPNNGGATVYTPHTYTPGGNNSGNSAGANGGTTVYTPHTYTPGATNNGRPAAGNGGVTSNNGVTTYTPRTYTPRQPTNDPSGNSQGDRGVTAPAANSSAGVTRSNGTTTYTPQPHAAAAGSAGSSVSGQVAVPTVSGQPPQGLANTPYVVVGFAFAYGFNVSSSAWGACWSVKPGGYVQNAPGGPNDPGNCALTLCKSKAGTFNCPIHEVHSNPEGTWASMAREPTENGWGEYSYGWGMNVTSDGAENAALAMCNSRAETKSNCTLVATFPLDTGGMLSGGSFSPQEYVKPTYDNCIQNRFFDPSMYNWLTVENSCDTELMVLMIWNDGSGSPGTMDIPPGGKTNTGNSKTDMQQHNGLQFYPCPVNYIAVEPDGKTQVHTAVKEFICKYSG